MEENKQ